MTPLSARPLSLTMSPDGRRVLLGIQEEDKVVFVSVASHAVERVIQLEKDSGPDPAIVLR